MPSPDVVAESPQCVDENLWAAAVKLDASVDLCNGCLWKVQFTMDASVNLCNSNELIQCGLMSDRQLHAPLFLLLYNSAAVNDSANESVLERLKLFVANDKNRIVITGLHRWYR